MVRMSKQGERRSRCPKKHKNPSPKTGPKKDQLPLGFKEHLNAIEGDKTETIFIAKVK